MNQDQEHLLKEIEQLLVGNYSQAISEVGQKLVENIVLIRNEEFLSKLEDLLYEAYPEETLKNRKRYDDSDKHSDNILMAKIDEMLAAGEVTEARFAMEDFIRSLDSDFDQYNPKPGQRHLSIFDLVGRFEFLLHEEAGMQLLPTHRDFSKIYQTYAKVLLQANERKEAADAYQQALLWHPYQVAMIYDLAALYLDMDQYGMAYAMILKGLKYSIERSALARGYACLAKFYAGKGDLEAALNFAKISLRWKENEGATDLLESLKEEGLEVEEPSTNKEVAQILQDYKLDQFPSDAALCKLVNMAQAAVELGNMKTARFYFKLYQSLTQDQEVAADAVIANLQRQLNM
ncbi:hypothetical protein [Aerococcus sp. UMB7834]|uniref:hypothetical protein n=1 Tax=Aerococcus sp. UMB7834 TaxID=3046342 RepID=UPI00254E97FA|nr:hypothetical protein [Aerococcus sp. UMB7834]MDK6805471.1 hypothetical protein [Aerococcus sp. UMB7834]